jgi:hypothetical protein
VPSIAPYSKHWNLIQTMFAMNTIIMRSQSDGPFLHR